MQFPGGSCCPGCSLRSHPGVSCICTIPAALPAGRKVLSGSCQQKAAAKASRLSSSQTEKLFMKIPNNGHRRRHSFQRLLTSLPRNFFCLWLISCGAMCYSATVWDMNQNHVRLIHLSWQS